MVPLHSHESSNSSRGNVEVVAFSCDLSTKGWERAGWITTAAERGPGRQSGQQEYKKIGRDGGDGGGGGSGCTRCALWRQDRFSFLPSTQVWFVVPIRARAGAPRVEVTALTCAVSPPPPPPQVVLLSSASRGSAGYKTFRGPFEIST